MRTPMATDEVSIEAPESTPFYEAMETAGPLHVVIVASPGMGHIIPMLELAKNLISIHALFVTLFVHTTDAPLSKFKLELSLDNIPDLEIVGLPPVSLSNIPSDAPEGARVIHIVERSLPSIQTALSNLVSTTTYPMVIVLDIFGGQIIDILKQLHLPKYLFYTSPAAVLAFKLYLPLLGSKVDFCSFNGPIEVPGCAPIQITDLIEPLNDRKKNTYEMFLNFIGWYTEVKAILVNTSEELELKSIRALKDETVFRQIRIPPVYSVGPLIKSGEKFQPGAEYLKWLDKQPMHSVLFVSFGTAGNLSRDQIKEIALGLEQSQQRFLWVVRRPKDITQKIDSEDVLGCLPDGFVGRTCRRGMVVPWWIPQVKVLNHGSVGGFMSHCGWNSALESLVYGIPMIAWPLYAEQAMNASMLCNELMVAIRVIVGQDGIVSHKEVERAARVLMLSDERKVLKARVEQIKDSVIRSMSEGGSSYNSLSRVVSEWRKDCEFSKRILIGRR